MNNFEVREVELKAKVKQSFTVLYLSDFHFKSNRKPPITWMLGKINTLNPDIILLGGDYVDTRKGWEHFVFFLDGISTRVNCFAIGGNHDYFFGIKKIEEILLEKGIHWLEKSSAKVYLDDFQIQIDGNQVQNDHKESDFSILCAHKPSVLNGNLNNYHLAFAGHLHGSQFVFWENEKGLYPGRFFYKWNILQTEKDNCTCLISKGLGDTLPIRYNCKKDIIFVKVFPTKSEHV